MTYYAAYPVMSIDNFAKYKSIFENISLLDSTQNLLQNDHCISHLNLKTLLHYYQWRRNEFESGVESTGPAQK